MKQAHARMPFSPFSLHNKGKYRKDVLIIIVKDKSTVKIDMTRQQTYARKRFPKYR